MDEIKAYALLELAEKLQAGEITREQYDEAAKQLKGDTNEDPSE